MHIEIRPTRLRKASFILLAVLSPSFAFPWVLLHEEPMMKITTAIAAFLIMVFAIGSAWYSHKSRLVLTDEAIELFEPLQHVRIPWNEITECVLAGQDLLVVKADDGTILRTHVWGLRQRENVRAVLCRKTCPRHSPVGHLSVGAWFVLAILMLLGSVLLLTWRASTDVTVIWLLGLPFGATATLLIHWLGEIRTYGRSALFAISLFLVVSVFVLLSMLVMKMLAPDELDAERGVRFMPPAMLGIFFSQSSTSFVLAFLLHRKPSPPLRDDEIADSSSPQEHDKSPSPTPGELR